MPSLGGDLSDRRVAIAKRENLSRKRLQTMSFLALGVVDDGLVADLFNEQAVATDHRIRMNTLP
jgi:hypothetical protein